MEGEVNKENPRMIRVFRDEIARHLIDAAADLYPQEIKFHFGMGVSGVNLDAKTVAFSGQDKETQVCHSSPSYITYITPGRRTETTIY